nr:hypothetical protein Iba_chr06bCG0810 [Ipomoea batatas]
MEPYISRSEQKIAEYGSDDENEARNGAYLALGNSGSVLLVSEDWLWHFIFAAQCSPKDNTNILTMIHSRILIELRVCCYFECEDKFTDMLGMDRLCDAELEPEAFGFELGKKFLPLSKDPPQGLLGWVFTTKDDSVPHGHRSYESHKVDKDFMDVGNESKSINTKKDLFKDMDVLGCLQRGRM